ncbi:MAG TPA: FIST N-terminal domain-containing protein [Polyangiaceae bacterium]
MIRFGAAISTSSAADDAAREAAALARTRLGDGTVALAVVFASASYDDVAAIPAVLEEELGGTPLLGGTSGGAVFDGQGVARRGVLVALLGGDGVRATVASAAVTSAELLETVPAAERILAEADAAARGGFEEALCLAFAPGVRVDGDAFVAAVRKGTAARMQLAGGLTGDDFTFDRARVFAGGESHTDRVVLAGLFTRTRVGIGTRHGLEATGPSRCVSGADASWVLALDGRRAIDVWTDDARAAGGTPPADLQTRKVYLANHFPLGIDVPTLPEPVVRVPLQVRDDGAVRVGLLGEGARVRLMRPVVPDMLRASHGAADLARTRVDSRPGGALVFACAGRLTVLGERFGEEPRAVARSLRTPIAGACMFGEIARAHREVDAFHNYTAVVAAFPS